MTAEVRARDARDDGSARAAVLPASARWSAATMVAAALGAGELLWFAVELLRGYFWQDDFVFLHLGGTVPLGELLLRGYNGHLQPGAFLLSWLVSHLAPLSWPAAVLPMLLMHGAALVLFWLLMVRLFGERMAIVVPFVAVAFSPLTFGLSMWWAYALQLLPVQLALFGALYGHLAYLQSTRSRPRAVLAVVAALFTAFGLAFGEKAVLIPFVLLGVTLALTPGGAGGRVVAVLRRHGGLWLAYLVLLAGYVSVHLWRAPLADSAVPRLRDILSLVRSMIGDGLLPALFGGPWSGDWVGFRGLAPPQTAVLAITWTLFAIVVLLGLWLGRARAAFAWLTLGGYLAVSVLLVASARLGPWGAIIGTDPRYVADSLPVAVVCAALALLRPRTDLRAPVPAGTRAAPVSDGSGATPVSDGSDGAAGPHAAGLGRAAVLPLALAAALVVGAVTSITGVLPELRHESTRDYVENVAAAAELEPDLVLYDTAVPPDTVLPLFGDNAMASRALHGLGIRFDQPAEDLRMLDATGTPRKIGLVATVPGKPAPVPGCGYPVGPQITRVPLVERAEGPRLVVQLGYYAQMPTDGMVSTPAREFRVHFAAGLHLVSVVADGPFSEVLVKSEGPVCLTNALVGLPLPHPN